VACVVGDLDLMIAFEQEWHRRSYDGFCLDTA
jgi:hypothetical protein